MENTAGGDVLPEEGQEFTRGGAQVGHVKVLRVSLCLVFGTFRLGEITLGGSAGRKAERSGDKSNDLALQHS